MHVTYETFCLCLPCLHNAQCTFQNLEIKNLPHNEEAKKRKLNVEELKHSMMGVLFINGDDIKPNFGMACFRYVSATVYAMVENISELHFDLLHK